MSEDTTPKQLTPRQFTHEDTTYEVVLKKIGLKGNIHTAEEVAQDEALQAEVVKRAWRGPEGRRDEDEFAENNVLRIVY